MSTNVSKEKRERLIEEIKEIKTYIASAPQDENTAALLTYIAEIEKDIRSKKYGLVFEEHREAVDELLETHTPVLTEQKELFIDNGGKMNFLIEGDNLAALKLLEKTHKGKIDIIYIDPPYNTGNKDFIYDDDFVGKEDSFRHSQWLSFMKNRLSIARDLMSIDGVLFMSIDDFEVTPAKMILDEIFGENRTQIMIWRKSGDGRDGKMKNTTTFRIDHEYLLVAYKSIIKLNKLCALPSFVNDYPNPDNDPRGKYKAGSISRKESASNPNHKNYYTVVSPSGKTFTRQFDISKEEFDALNNDILINCDGKSVSRIYWGRNGDGVPSLKIFINEERLVTPSSILLQDGTTTEGTKELNEILQGDYSSMRAKPSRLIKSLIQLGSKKDSTVLDFFAGSGTTGQACLQQNDRDCGKRTFILCTNNENNICREVTYERIKRVIARDNFAASLKYYKVEYIPISDRLYYEYADELLRHIRELVELENGINFIGNAEIAIILTEAELDAFTASVSGSTVCKTIYLGHDVLTSEAQEQLFKEHNISVNVIPDYYYRDLEG